MGLGTWLWQKLDMPAFSAEQHRRRAAWDYAQTNNQAIWDADPLIARVTEAIALVDRDPEHAFYLLLTLAHDGSIWSMLYAGWCCENGRGVPANLSDAEYWYRRAHEAGCDRATLDYGTLLTQRSALDLAQQVYAIGVKRNWAPALYRSARLILREAESLETRLVAKPLLERAAAQGSPLARLLLSKYLLRGWFGARNIPAGLRQAAQLLREVFSGPETKPDAPAAEPQAAPPNTSLH